MTFTIVGYWMSCLICGTNSGHLLWIFWKCHLTGEFFSNLILLFFDSFSSDLAFETIILRTLWFLGQARFHSFLPVFHLVYRMLRNIFYILFFLHKRNILLLAGPFIFVCIRQALVFEVFYFLAFVNLVLTIFGGLFCLRVILFSILLDETLIADLLFLFFRKWFMIYLQAIFII